MQISRLLVPSFYNEDEDSNNRTDNTHAYLPHCSVQSTVLKHEQSKQSTRTWLKGRQLLQTLHEEALKAVSDVSSESNRRHFITLENIVNGGIVVTS